MFAEPQFRSRSIPHAGTNRRALQPPTTTGVWSMAFARLTDLGLACILFLLPLIMGGRHPWGRLAYVSVVGLTAICWSLHRWTDRSPASTIRWSGLEWILALGAGLMIVQIVSLPREWITYFSPKLATHLPLWFSPAGAWESGAWTSLSVAPRETLRGLAMYTAHGLLFVLLMQRFKSLEDLERAMWLIAAAGIMMAGLGLAQLFLGNGKYLWVYQHPSRDTFRVAKGPFENQNHFAQWLALCLGPLWWCWAHGSSRLAAGHRSDIRRTEHRRRVAARQTWLVAALGLCGLAAVLSMSRGGLLAFGLASVICFAAEWRDQRGRGRVLAALATCGAMVLAALTIYGLEALERRLAMVVTANSLAQVSEGRDVLWKALRQAIHDFPLLGTGVGSLRFVYPVYMRENFNFTFAYGESGYLQTWLESGTVGLVMVLFAWSWLLGRLAHLVWFGKPRERAMAVALLAGLTANMVHSFVDFVWFIPACMSLTVFLAAATIRLSQLANTAEATAETSAGRAPRWWHRGIETTLRRRDWAMLTVAAGALTLAMVAVTYPMARASSAWEAYLRTSFEFDRIPNMQLDEEAERIRQMHRYLARAVQHDPDDARLQLRYAALCARRFDVEQRKSPNPLELTHIRDAAIASQFKDVRALAQWLQVATGPHYRLLFHALLHARRSVELCPLQGEGYVLLANLDFLNVRDRSASEQLLDQAVRVRPYEGTVLFALGSEAAIRGDTRRAFDFWKRAFQGDPGLQPMMIRTLGSQLPAELFLQIVEPDRPALAKIYAYYRGCGRVEQARVVARPYAEASERFAQATPVTGPATEAWREAVEAWGFLGEADAVARCAAQGLRLAPNDFALHRQLAEALAKSKRLEAAIEQFQWCIARKPDDKGLLTQLAACRRELLTSSPAPASAPDMPSARLPRPSPVSPGTLQR